MILLLLRWASCMKKKKRNNVFSRHLLVSRRQVNEQNVLEYLRALQLLAKDCTFVDVRARTYRDELMRDSFINGLKNPSIRQRLLEKDDIDLQRAADLADSLERAQLQSDSMSRVATGHSLTTSVPRVDPDQNPEANNS